MLSKKKDIWIVISLCVLAFYIVFMIFPLGILFKNAVIENNGSFTFAYFTKFLSKNYYFSTIFNSFKVSLAATALTLIIGTNTIRNLIGFNVPSIYGFGGILLVLCMQLYPLVFLYVSGALRNIDNSLLEASENMGCTGARRFFKIIIPLCIPTILAAALMVFMRAFADFGTPLFIGEGYRTFPVEIYNQFMNETGSDKNFASAVSIIAIIITSLIFLLQRYINGKYKFTMNALHPIEAKEAKGIKSILIHLYCYLIVFISYAPQLYVIYTSFQNTSGKLFTKGYSLKSYTEAFSKVGNAIQNTFFIGGLALILIIVISILIAYLVVRRNNFMNRTIDTLSMVPYVIPGSVVGIALVSAFNKKPFVLVGTFLIMVISLIIRRNAYTIRSSVAILQQIPISIEEAAISLGASRMKSFFKITTPMMMNGIISGALLSWITIITELSSSIILYNYKTITLTLQIYVYVSRGSYGIAAAMSAILTLMTVVSLLIFMRVSKNKNVMM